MARLLTALTTTYRYSLLCGAAIVLTVAGLFHYQLASAALVKSRSVQLDNPAVSATNVRYTVQVGVTTPGTLGSIKIMFCGNTSLLADSCTPPAGFDLSAAVLASETGLTGFTIDDPSSTANKIVLSRTPVFTASGTGSYELTNIVNPSTLGTTFVRIFTYASADATGPYSDAGGLAFTTNNDVNLSAKVPPYLLFCTGVSIAGYNCGAAEGDLIDFGALGPTRTASGSSQLVAATNGTNGYSVRVASSDFASGTNVINPMTGQASAIGQSQFGMNLRANVQPELGDDVQGPGRGAVVAGYDVPDRFRFTNGDVIASSPIADDYRKYTVSYVVNVPKDQPGGMYAATLTYICLANF